MNQRFRLMKGFGCKEGVFDGVLKVLVDRD